MKELILLRNKGIFHKMCLIVLILLFRQFGEPGEFVLLYSTQMTNNYKKNKQTTKSYRLQMKFSEYFVISHYLPEGVHQRNKEMAKYLRNSHFCKLGLHAKEAEQNFVRYIQEMKEYGLHLYSALWVSN